MFLGTQYYRPPHPALRHWESDFPIIKDHGFKLIRTWLWWGRANPQPGVFRWDDYDRFFELAEKHDIQILAQIMLEGAPYWVQDRYPEILYRDDQGHPSEFFARAAIGIGGWPGPCFDNPVARELAEEFMVRAVERYGSAKTLRTWDIWNELYPFSHPYHPVFGCYCSGTTARFREYLKGKYESIEALNETWSRGYADWGEVRFPRRGEYADTLDLGEFNQRRAADWIAWKAGLVRRHDPAHEITAHPHGSCIEPPNMEDDWLLTESIDVWGVSSYLADYYENSLRFDGIRSSARGKPWWLSEQSGGRVGHFLGDYFKSQAMIKSMVFLSFSHGADGSIFWQWRPETFGDESPCYGLTNQNGSLNERTALVKEIAAMLERHKDVFDQFRLDPAAVAILWEPKSYGIDKFSLWDQGKPPLGPANIAGYHRALTSLGLTVELLNARIVATDGVPNGVKLLVAPYQIIDRRGLVGQIGAWVERGGTLVAGPLVGLYGDNSYTSESCPPAEWVELLGAAQRHFDNAEAPSIELLGSVASGGPRELMGHAYLEEYRLEGGEAVGVSEAHPTLVRRRYGSGQAYTVGSFVGANSSEAGRAALLSWLGGLCRSAGVQATVQGSGGVLLRTGLAGAARLVFLHNPRNQQVASWISLPAGAEPAHVRDLFSEADLGGLTSERPVVVDLAPLDSRVLALRRD